MNSVVRWSLLTVVALGIALALLAGGIVLGRSAWAMAGYGPAGMMGGYAPGGYGQPANSQAPYGYGMMGNNYGQAYTGTVPYGYGMMGGGMMGNGYGQVYTGTTPYGPGMMGGGMMGGGMMGGGMMGGGMMGGYGSSALRGVKPLSPVQAQSAVKDYLSGLGNSDLIIDEVMVFDNQAYVRVVEKSTGVGAFEVLVDPVTLAVTPEPGPNMMWNLKYSPMGGFGMMGGGMMGGALSPKASAEMPVSSDEALKTAQRFLDAYLPGAKTADTADGFYGYYTIDILRDGRIAGMLSVNGYTRQVFLHTWHGNFLEMVEGTQN